MTFNDDYESTLSKTYSMIAKGEQARRDGSIAKVFDWDKAREIINQNPTHTYSAGLVEDWFWTGGTIWESGEQVNAYCYLASIWATPILRDENDEINHECWIYKTETDWDESTMWP